MPFNSSKVDWQGFTIIPFNIHVSHFQFLKGRLARCPICGADSYIVDFQFLKGRLARKNCHCIFHKHKYPFNSSKVDWQAELLKDNIYNLHNSFNSSKVDWQGLSFFCAYILLYIFQFLKGRLASRLSRENSG